VGGVGWGGDGVMLGRSGWGRIGSITCLEVNWYGCSMVELPNASNRLLYVRLDEAGWDSID